ncbi:MICOS complex subunit Mic10-like [Spodoptera litura]|uniref:MICOS complex subunit MIC10 n=1 Tax=Spodoptera litura TaxID=69820 RepID=A0A9J7DTT1_SPOLT|nr:MICOS complex subunit Mic10-like [Spodoptera litura]
MSQSTADVRDFEERYSACFVDFGLKSAAGLLIGSMVGSFFLRGYKKWPMYIGGGLGFGLAYTNCENSLNQYLMSMDPKACKIKKTA